MKSWVFAAGLVAAAFVPPAGAADLGGNGYGAYDDRRYHAAPPAYDDDDRYDDRSRSWGRRFSGTWQDRACVRSEEVRDSLTDGGWRDFHDGHEHGDVVTLRARRPNGRLFELTLQRCSGRLVEARPLEPRPFGPFAYRNNYDRWDGTYAYRDRPWWRRGY
jgi:hypothetical protein